MLFNSLDFAIFLPIVFILYWAVRWKSLRSQNMLILAASLVFYGWWDLRFLFLLIFSIWLDFFTGLKIYNAKSQKSAKAWLLVSVFTNLAFLGFFKYFNFFIESTTAALESFGFQPNPWSLAIILPVGISFYTFHGLSYVFDIYNKKITPTNSAIDYAVFVSFFPLLVAGPIERATHLLPQVERKRVFSYEDAADGLRRILWGLFKKIVIADNCATYANEIFDNHTDYNGSTLMLGAVLFAFQIYGDFSGYSDIALGTARLFGFNLLKNFSYPYFSRDIAEFWRRWHMSLSGWFRDYLYIPLGGSKGSTLVKIRNTFIIFIVSGFWHGANWTFIVWGFLNAVYFIPLLLLKQNRTNLDIVAKGRVIPTPKDALSMLVTFLLTVIAWIFFRSETVGQGTDILSTIFSPTLFSSPYILDEGVPSLPTDLLRLIVLIAFFIVMEWTGRDEDYAIAKFGRTWRRPFRYAAYYAAILLILWFAGNEQAFIYFQF